MKGRLASLFCVLTFASMAVTSPAAEVQDNNAGLSRGEMAQEVGQVLGFTPPPCVAGSETFADVPASNPFCIWIEELVRRGITSGCGGGNYCPLSPVTRDQMAVFQVKALTAGGSARAIVTRTATTLPNLRIGTWTVNRPGVAPTGVYCLTVAGVSPATDAAIVNVEWGQSLGFDLLAYWVQTPFQCAAGQYEIRTYQFAAGGTPVLSNNVQFLVVIP